MIKSLKDLLDKFSRFTNSLVYDGGICKRLSRERINTILENKFELWTKLYGPDYVKKVKVHYENIGLFSVLKDKNIIIFNLKIVNKLDIFILCNRSK